MDATPAELAELKNVFRAECQEHLTALDSLLLKLEQTPGNTLVLQETFRRIHSIKGAARMVGDAGIEAVAHAMESMLAQARDGSTAPAPGVIATLFEGTDALAELLRSDAGRSADEPAVRAVLERLRSAEVSAGAHAEPTPEAQPPRARSGRNPEHDVVRITTEKVDTLLAFPGELMRDVLGEERELREVQALLDSLLESIHGLRASGERRRQESAARFVQDLGKRGDRLRELVARLSERSQRRARTLDDLRYNLAGLGMQPVQTILTGMPRLVRDTALALGKRVRLRVSGAEVEIGRSVLDKLMEPLIHIVRNAIAHGIETPERRAARGKNPTGTVSISVTTGTASATIVVEDDGEGVDLERIREHVVARGLASTEQAAGMDESALLAYLFQPGFSTRTQTDAVAGRGVGLDVVAERIASLRGSYRVETRAGQGFRIALTVPVDVLWSSVLAVKAGRYDVCVRLTDIAEAAVIRSGDVVRIEGRLCALVHGEAVPLVPLSSLGGAGDDITFGLDGSIVVLVLAYAGRRAAFVIDALAGVSDVIVKALPRPMGSLPGIAGYTVSADGVPACVVDGEYLVRMAYESNGATQVRHIEPAARRAILVVEDSMTTRTLLRNIFIGAGYDVETAIDGADAWAKLRARRYACIVSDIEMPNMNGWDLCARVKADPNLSETPFVLITSLSKDEERERGVRLGADAYMLKGLFNERELLETVERLVA
jgi:two-component system chemotaxis sensor kinase CheA